MRFRWPTSAATSALSRRRTVEPPALPPIQASLSCSRLSSYSCATLICNMRLPGCDVLVNRARVGVAGECRAQVAVAQHLRELGEHLQVLLGRVLRHEEQENQADGLAVRRVERHRLGEAHKGADRLLEPLDPAVRDCDALAQPGRSQALPREQAVEHEAAGDTLIVLEEQPGLLEHALLARYIQVEKDVRRRQEFCN